jgi:outer membrane protein OmpA-like peptidoglycan-associated protein
MRTAMLARVTLGGAMALGGCSQHQEQPQAPASEMAASPEATAPLRPHPTPGPGSNLTGQVSALASGVGGLDIRVTDTGTIIDLPADALFDFDKATLTPGATEQLEKSAQMIRSAPAGAIRIVGHTDSKGDDAYNQKLSEARAQTVADWFARQVGVRQREFQVSGMGERAPIAPDQTPDGQDNPTGRAKNRRVEVVLPKTA